MTSPRPIIPRPPSPGSLPSAAPEPLFHDLTRDDVFRLETRRLWLRWPRLVDAPAIIRQAGRREVAEMTANIPHPYPPEQADPFIFEARKGNATGRHLVLAVTPKGKPGELIGMVGAHAGPDGKPFIGYWLGKEHWGSGYATEAAQALIDAVFTFTGAREVEATARVVNPASRRVLAKCGFRHGGSVMRELVARGGLFPCDSFRLERSTWEALRAWGQAPLPETTTERPRLVPMSLALPWSDGLCPA